MKIIGIDLAGSEKNDTGIAVLDEEKNAEVRVVHSNREIFGILEKEIPDLIAIDAPLTDPGTAMRQADKELKDLGALPINMGGMRVLTERGVLLKKKLSAFRVIEVLVRASKKILGYGDEPVKSQKKLISLGFKGEIERRMLGKDEIDAIIAAITGMLYTLGKAREVGGQDGKIVVPVV